MNAGEREKQWMKEAFPVRIQDSCEDNWNVCMESGDVSDQKLFRDWISQVPGSLAPSHLVVAAIRNLRLGIRPPESGMHLNYYSDWIGVQMRTMIHGMLAPGNPKLAAELAVRDGIISHSNSGILGGMFNAVLISLAFVERDIRELLRKTIDCIPKDSEYYQVLLFALKQCEEQKSWREAWRKCEKKYEDYNWIHVYPNVAAQIIALWYGNGDFDKTAEIICMEGKDADCTAAPVLNALGIMFGSAVLDKKWTEPLGTEIHLLLRKYKTISLDKLCEVTVESVRQFCRKMA